MPRDQTRNKQPSVEPADHESGGELVPSTTAKGSTIPGFSAEQVQHLNAMMDAKNNQIMTVINEQAKRLEASQEETNRRLDALIQALTGNTHTNLPAIGQSSQQSSQQPSQEHANQPFDSSQVTLYPPTSSPPAQPIFTTRKPEIRAETVGYFDPDYQQEKEQGVTNQGPVVNAEKHVYYRDVYVFVDRLKDLAR